MRRRLLQDVFYEADELLATSACHHVAGTGDVGDVGSQGPRLEPREAVMSVVFERFSVESPLYDNVDSKLSIKVAAAARSAGRVDARCAPPRAEPPRVAVAWRAFTYIDMCVYTYVYIYIVTICIYIYICIDLW